MPSIFVLNNYCLEQDWLAVKRKEKPDHVLFGINHFKRRGFQVKIIPFQDSQILQTFNNFYKNSRLPIPIGDLDQQWSVLRRLNEADIIYAACHTQTHFLNYLRALGLIKTPIICVAHSTLNPGRLAKYREPFIKLFIKGTDAFPSLTQEVANEINQLSDNSCKSSLVSWGPDANFYPSIPARGQGVVAMGRTGRDFNTFGIADHKLTLKLT